MWPIGPLMHEHRLIERMVKVAAGEAARLRQGGALDPLFIDALADFFRAYADRCHHGKEEEILFVDLAGRDLSPELKAIMAELVQEHQLGRQMVRGLLEAKERCQAGEGGALPELAQGLERLAEFYPAHIAKEDQRFFFPCMEYLDRSDKDAMLAAFWEFDRQMIHEVYAQVVGRAEARPRAGLAGPEAS